MPKISKEEAARLRAERKAREAEQKLREEEARLARVLQEEDGDDHRFENFPREV